MTFELYIFLIVCDHSMLAGVLIFTMLVMLVLSMNTLDVFDTCALSKWFVEQHKLICFQIQAGLTIRVRHGVSEISLCM